MRLYAAIAAVILLAATPARAQDEEEEAPSKKSFDVMGEEEAEEEEEPVIESAPEPKPKPPEEPEVREPEPAPAVPAGPRALVLVIAETAQATGAAVRIGKAATRELAKTRALAPADIEKVIAPGLEAIRAEDIKAGLAGVDRGLTAFGELELEVAGTELETAINTLLSYSDDLDRDARRALENAIFALAATSLFGGQTSLAESIFVALLLMSPSYAPNAENYPSNVVARFEELKGRVEQLPTGSLTVNTVPRGSDVIVDGTYRGSSPVEVTGLADGQHIIIAKRLGYKPYGTLAPVSAEHSASIDVDLEPIAGADLEKELRPELAGDLQAALQFGRKADVAFLAVFRFDKGLTGSKIAGQWIDVSKGVALGKIPVTPVLEDPEVASKTILEAITKSETAPLVAAAAVAEESGSITGAWWFWTIVGALAVAGGSAAVVAATRGGDERRPPGTAVFGF